MAYKRYITKEGKKFGPYYYESYRGSDGKVKKKYVGTTDPDKGKNKINYNFKPATIVLSILISLEGS